MLGQAWTRDDRAIRERIGISLQETRLADKLTVRDTVVLFRSFYKKGIDPETADRFIEMYVNESTCDYGDEGRQAVAELLRRAEASGAYEQPVRVDFV